MPSDITFHSITSFSFTFIDKLNWTDWQSESLILFTIR